MDHNWGRRNRPISAVPFLTLLQIGKATAFPINHPNRESRSLSNGSYRLRIPKTCRSAVHQTGPFRNWLKPLMNCAKKHLKSHCAALEGYSVDVVLVFIGRGPPVHVVINIQILDFAGREPSKPALPDPRRRRVPELLRFLHLRYLRDPSQPEKERVGRG